MRQDGQGFTTKTSPTIGAAFSSCTVTAPDAGSVHMQIWDTAGEERFRSMVAPPP